MLISVIGKDPNTGKDNANTIDGPGTRFGLNVLEQPLVAILVPRVESVSYTHLSFRRFGQVKCTDYTAISYGKG